MDVRYDFIFFHRNTNENLARERSVLSRINDRVPSLEVRTRISNKTVGSGGCDEGFLHGHARAYSAKSVLECSDLSGKSD